MVCSLYGKCFVELVNNYLLLKSNTEYLEDLDSLFKVCAMLEIMFVTIKPQIAFNVVHGLENNHALL